MVFCGKNDSDTLEIALQSEEPFRPGRKGERHGDLIQVDIIDPQRGSLSPVALR